MFTIDSGPTHILVGLRQHRIVIECPTDLVDDAF